jgi:hypothetical protein
MFRYTGNGRGSGGAALRPSVPESSEPAASDASHAMHFPGAVLGEVTTRTGYDHIVQIMKTRFAELRAAGGLGSLTVEHFKRWGPVTLGPQLGVLKIKLIVAVDEVAFAQIKDRLTPAKFRRWRSYGAGAGMLAIKRRNPGSFRNFGHGRAARMAQLEAMSPKQRSRAAKRAARARWAKAAQMRHVENRKSRPAPVARPSVVAAAVSAHAVMAKA